MQPPDVPGKPDFVFREQKLAVFVDGCFWHGCPRCYRAPKSNKEYWGSKVTRNRERDRRVVESLECEGWKTVRIWEHEVVEDPASTVKTILSALSAAGKR